VCVSMAALSLSVEHVCHYVTGKLRQTKKKSEINININI